MSRPLARRDVMMFSAGVPALLLHSCMRFSSHVMFHGERFLSIHLCINGLLVLSVDGLVRPFMSHLLVMATTNLNSKWRLDLSALQQPTGSISPFFKHHPSQQSMIFHGVYIFAICIYLLHCSHYSSYIRFHIYCQIRRIYHTYMVAPCQASWVTPTHQNI